MNAWGLAIVLLGALAVFLGITGKGEDVINGARSKSGNPVKTASS